MRNLNFVITRAPSPILRQKTNNLAALPDLPPPSGSSPSRSGPLILLAIFVFISALFRAAPAQASNAFFTTPPCRLYDSRVAAPQKPLISGEERTLQVTGACGIPAGAVALSANVTVVAPASDGYLSVLPEETGRVWTPPTAALTFQTNLTRSNHGVFALSTGGALDLQVFATSGHVVVDVDGYFADTTSAPVLGQGPLVYNSLWGCRARDASEAEAPTPSGAAQALSLRGVCGMPDSARAAIVNLQLNQPSALGYAMAYSSAQALPATYISIFAPLAGRSVSNGAIVELGPSPGDTKLFYQGYPSPATTGLTIDTTGYFGEGQRGAVFHPLRGCRAFDTRIGNLPLTSQSRDFDLRTACALPLDASALAYSVTVVSPSGAGDLVLYPTDRPEPASSAVTFATGEMVSNGGIVDLAKFASGLPDLRVAARIGSANPSVHAIVDVTGYFTEQEVAYLPGNPPDSGFAEIAFSRGIQPDKPFHFNDLDHINLFNGSLNIAIPLGSTYSVGPDLSYRFLLTYSSNFWQPHEDWEGYQIPSRDFNAGPGWQVSFGKLVLPGPSGRPNQEFPIYLGSDAAQHTFFPTLHPSDSEDAGDLDNRQYLLYTRDGSYLRLTQRTAAHAAYFPSDNKYRYRLEFPNGEIHYFDAGGRIVEMRDRHFSEIGCPLNWVRFQYSDSKITITDGTSTQSGSSCTPVTNRTHVASLVVKPQYPKTLERLELDSWQGGKLPITFAYEDHWLSRPCAKPEQSTDLEVQVPLLRTVQVGSDTANDFVYEMPDYIRKDGPGEAAFDEADRNDPQKCLASGALQAMQLPTGGRIEWDWQRYTISDSSFFNKVRYPGVNGVKERRTYFAQDTEPLAKWVYLNSMQALKEVTTTVEARPRIGNAYPLEHATKAYFSVYAADFQSNPEGWRRRDWGLPFTRFHSRDNLFLSTETLDANGTTLRSSWVRYESDEGATQYSAESSRNHRAVEERSYFHDDCAASSGCGTGDYLLRDYRFAGSHHLGSTWDGRPSWDGLGHFRVDENTGNFASGNQKRQETGYPERSFPLPASSPWIHQTYAYERISEPGSGGVSFASFEFDAATGDLSWRRIHASGNNLASNQDIVLTLERSCTSGGDCLARDRGQVTRKIQSGGDTLSAAVQNLTYQCNQGEIATSTPAGMSYKTIDATVDCKSGLISSSRDSGGISTSFTYDLLGRLVSRSVGGAELTASNREVPTTYTYQVSTTGKSSVTTQRSGAGGQTQVSKQIFDSFGRLWTEIREHTRVEGSTLRPHGVDYRYLAYDAFDNLTATTTWRWAINENSIVLGGPDSYETKYKEFDPFGRAHQIVNPDGAITYLDYTGVRSIRTRSRVGRAFNSANQVVQESTETTRQFDRQGRLVKVIEPSEDLPPADLSGGIRCSIRPVGQVCNDSADCECQRDTKYSYDEGDRLVRVVQESDLGNQERTFDYDQRGFLIGESHPELDAIGDGSAYDVRYGCFDATGQPGTRRDALHRLRFRYDAGGRLVDTDEIALGNDCPDASTPATVPLLHFQYGTGGSAGRLTYSERHNYRGDAGAQWDLVLRQTYLYGGVAGRVSSQVLLLSTRGPGASTYISDEKFTTNYTYNNLGELTAIDYPFCSFSTPGVCNTSISKLRKVQYEYRQGLPTSIRSTVPELSWYTGQLANEEPNVGLNYHSNGLWADVTLANGKAYHQELAVNGMPRPAALVFDGIGANSAGIRLDYRYDDAGNLTVLGSERYFYDRARRLYKACMGNGLDGGSWASPTPLDSCRGEAGTLYQEDTQHFTYDAFGNLQNIAGTNGHGRATMTDWASNRLKAPTQYDGAGQMTSWNGQTYQWDALGSQAVSSPSANETWFHLYDAAGERIVSTSPAVNGQPRRDRWTLRDLDGKVLREYSTTLWSNGWDKPKDYIYQGSRLVASHETDNDAATADVIHYYLQDHLGTTRLLLDGSGNALPPGLRYLPFGEQITPNEGASLNERMRFAGHERDLNDSSGLADDLDYMHARFYNGQIGRFLSVDPANERTALNNSQKWNRYSYVINSPLNFVDPDAHQERKPVAVQALGAFSQTALGLASLLTGASMAAGPVLLPALLITGGAASMVDGNYQLDQLATEHGCPDCVDRFWTGILLDLTRAAAMVKGAGIDTAITSEAGMGMSHGYQIMLNQVNLEITTTSGAIQNGVIHLQEGNLSSSDRKLLLERINGQIEKLKLLKKKQTALQAAVAEAKKREDQ